MIQIHANAYKYAKNVSVLLLVITLREIYTSLLNHAYEQNTDIHTYSFIYMLIPLTHTHMCVEMYNNLLNFFPWSLPLIILRKEKLVKLVLLRTHMFVPNSNPPLSDLMPCFQEMMGAMKQWSGESEKWTSCMWVRAPVSGLKC